jgi:hypothetical protein
MLTDIVPENAAIAPAGSTAEDNPDLLQTPLTPRSTSVIA